MIGVMSLEDFIAELEAFDWSHHMSDSFDVWRVGDKRMFELAAISRASGPKHAEIFNTYKRERYYVTGEDSAVTTVCKKCEATKANEHFTKGETWCKSCRKEVNDRNNSRNNHVRRWARLLSGLNTKDLYKLPKAVRAKWLDLSRDIVAAGSNYTVAASHEAKRTDGVIYVISHPHLHGVKIGRAFDADSRLNNYQTGCPNREYHLEHVSAYIEDVAAAEHFVHEWLKHARLKGEWFDLQPQEAKDLVSIALARFVTTS